MKFCPKCGTANTNSSTKCSCGEDLSNVSAENAQPTTKTPQKSAAFMGSKTCQAMVWVFIVLAIIGAIISETVLNAVVSAIALVSVAITFSALGGLLRNQEIQNEFMQEILNELKNKK